MKTTFAVEIENSIKSNADKFATEHSKTLTDVLEEALTAYLQSSTVATDLEKTLSNFNAQGSR
jgi:predicted transcriptional regulator